MTKVFAVAFDRTIAIEPNPHLLTQVKQAILQAQAIAAPILAAEPKAQGDLVLCSHTLYHIPAAMIAFARGDYGDAEPVVQIAIGRE